MPKPQVISANSPSTEVPPQDIPTEEAVLGAMLVSGKMLKLVRVDSGLTAQHFYFERNAEVFAAIQRVSEREGRADELLVAAELPQQRKYIAELAAKVPNAGNAKHYAKVVIKRANERAKLEGANRIIQGVREPDEHESELIIQEGLQLVTSDFTIDSQPTSKQELADAYFKFLDEDLPAEVFELPWAPLNRLTLGGLRRGQVTVLGGWTNMGKSLIVDQAVGALARAGKSVAIFGTEMGWMERVTRFVTARTGIAGEKLLLKQLTPDEIARVVKVLPEVPYDHFEADGWGAEKIAERIIFGGYDVVVLDPINLIPDFEDSRIASRAARRFIEVARRADCHLIVVAHLNRARANNQSGVLPRPVPRDLRDTGMLETNANQILFFHRDQDDQGRKLASGELYYAKVRNGMTGSVKVKLAPRYLTWQLDEPPATHEQEALAIPGPGHDRQAG